MKTIKITIVAVSLLSIYCLYRFSQPDCIPCKDEKFHVKSSCSPVRSAYTTVYRYLNCFCDNGQDWKEISNIIPRIGYYRGIYSEIYPYNVFGTKKISCFDDELQVDVFKDDEIFLYIEQDTSKTIYDGALKVLLFDDVWSNKIGLLDVGKGNKIVRADDKHAFIQYRMNYDELNSQALINFQQAIHYDSSYQKRFKKVDYQLINKETRRHDASIRYEDFGEWFYLDVF